jgi:hypothetical protein
LAAIKAMDSLPGEIEKLLEEEQKKSQQQEK